MTNLLTETISILKEHGKSASDVVWVGTKTGKTTWETFEILADKEYEDGFGGEEVNTSLLVVGEDWWIERHQYDGSEWWEYKQLPKTPEDKAFSKEGDRFEDEDGYYIFYE